MIKLVNLLEKTQKFDTGLSGMEKSDAESDFNQHHASSMYGDHMGTTADRDTIDFDDHEDDRNPGKVSPYNYKKDKIDRGYEPYSPKKYKKSSKSEGVKVELNKVYSNPYHTTFKPLKEEEDHEVSMGQSTLDDIIKNATELKEKIGQNEKDIPAWIQDHISQSQNFINQANTGYYETETN